MAFGAVTGGLVRLGNGNGEAPVEKASIFQGLECACTVLVGMEEIWNDRCKRPTENKKMKESVCACLAGNIFGSRSLFMASLAGTLGLSPFFTGGDEVRLVNFVPPSLACAQVLFWEINSF